MLNEWRIEKYLSLALAFLLANIGLIGLSALGFDIVVLRQIVGFIFLTFIPGNLILRILKIRNLNVVETILYSVGLSIAFIMLTGLFINVVFPHIGISKPISTLPVTLTLTIFMIILGAAAYISNKSYQPLLNKHHEKTELSVPSVLILTLLPFIASLGALWLTYRQENTVLLILICIIAIMPVLAIKGIIPRKLFPLAIFVISFSLLLHQTLISPYLTGWDIHIENYYQGLVVANGFWDASIPNNVNAMISITMLCPIYSIILGIDSIWVFKIFYPIIFSLVPLAVFEICRKQIGCKKAFLATFFFMSMLVFFTEMTALARQQIAELFFVLIVLLMIDNKLSQLQKTIMVIVFAMSMTVSHYGLAYIGIAFFGVGWILFKIIKSKTVINEEYNSTNTFTGTLVILYVVFLLSWYMYLSTGSNFNTIVYISNSLYSNLADFFNFTTRESLVGTALGLDFAHQSVSGKCFRIIQYLTQLFIILGLLKTIVKPKIYKFKLEYIALSMVAVLILFCCISIPLFANYLHVTRFYHIALITLSPFCILGGEILWQWLYRLFKSVLIRLKKWPLVLAQVDILSSKNNVFYSLFTVFILIPFFLFNTGFIFEITNEKYVPGTIPVSMSLSNYRVDFTDYYWKEAAGCKWLSDRCNKKTIVYGDHYSVLLLNDWLNGVTLKTFSTDIEALFEEIQNKFCIFLREWNIVQGEALLKDVRGAELFEKRISISDCQHLSNMINYKNLVYDNSGSQIIIQD